MTDPLTRPAAAGAEDDLDQSLRPKSLDAFIGQETIREKLGIFLQAAQGRGEALDHVLLARNSANRAFAACQVAVSCGA